MQSSFTLVQQWPQSMQCRLTISVPSQETPKIWQNLIVNVSGMQQQSENSIANYNTYTAYSFS